MTIEFHDTPLGIMATRPDLCWCEECRRKNPIGFGPTKDEAIAALLEDEEDRQCE